MFKHIGIALGLILLFSLIIPLLPVGIITMPVEATAGYTSVNITGSCYVMQMTTDANWPVMNSASVAENLISGTAMVAGFNTPVAGNPKWDTLSRGYVKFDLSVIPPGADVVSAKIHTMISNSAGTAWNNDYVGFYRVNIAGAAPALSEFGSVKSLRNSIASNYPFDSLTTVSTLKSWPIFASDLSYIMTPQSGTLTWAAFTSGFDIYGVTLSWASWKFHTCTIAPDTVKLEVTYARSAASRTMNVLVNAADYTGVLTGSENVSIVSWLTPRAAFADDINGMGWRFEGSPGAAFNYSVSSGTGELIVSGNNTIKDNGYYYLYASVPVTWEGWLRAKSTDLLANTCYSVWGRVEPPPNINQRLLSVSALDTEYPQYDYEFSRYVIYKNGVGYLYWKTNLETADMANYHIKLMAGGDQVNATSWNATMQYLNDYYFLTKDTNNYDMAHWRYLAFTPYISTTGFNTYDGFIINAAQDYSLTQTGFWQGSIRSNSDNSTLTYTDSAYFYLNDISQGVSITLDGYKVATSSEIQATINIGAHSQVGTRLRYLQVTLFDDLGEVAGSGAGFVSTGSNKVTFSAPLEIGNYQVRFEFYDDTLVPDYRYIKDVAFTVVASGAAGAIPPGEVPGTTGFFAWLNALLDSKGANNAAGHWIIIILLCVLVAAVFGVYGKMPLVATVIDILIFGIAIYIKWIDTWIIALLAIAAGFTIYRMFKKNTGEQKEV
jgi:hypothetical protein